MELHIGMWLLIPSYRLGPLVLAFETKNERTTIRGGMGPLSTTSVCTSIHGASSSVF